MPEGRERQDTAVLCFSPNAGGMEHDAISMAESINQYLANTILVVRKGTWLEEKGVDSGLTVVPIDFKGSFSLSAIFKMRKVWHEFGIKNIIFLGSSEIKSIHFSITPSVECFIVRHGTIKSSIKKDFVRRFTWAKVTAHWCISKHLEDNVRKIFPIGNTPTFVNYIALGDKLYNIPQARPIREDDEIFRLVHAGRLVKGKGQRDALTVLNHLHRRKIPANLTFYGDGDDEHYLRCMAAELGLTDSVKFAGYVKAPFSHFDEYHAFVYPSYGEGLGNSFIEALASGIHCLAYENTVFPELKSAGLIFHMVPDRSIDGLVESLSDIWYSSTPMPLENIDLCKNIFSAESEMDLLKKYLC